jgi:hypothetical protein
VLGALHRTPTILIDKGRQTRLDKILLTTKTLAMTKKDSDKSEHVRNRDPTKVKNRFCEGTKLSQ